MTGLAKGVGMRLTMRCGHGYGYSDGRRDSWANVIISRVEKGCVMKTNDDQHYRCLYGNASWVIDMSARLRLSFA